MGLPGGHPSSRSFSHAHLQSPSVHAAPGVSTCAALGPFFRCSVYKARGRTSGPRLSPKRGGEHRTPCEGQTQSEVTS